MRAFRFFSHLRLATALIVGALLSPVAGAIDPPTNATRITLSRGTASSQPVRTVPEADVAKVATAFDVDQRLIASVSASPFLTPASTLPFQEGNFDAATTGRFATVEAFTVGGKSVAPGATPPYAPEPGFWSAVASTLALALFFFVRRLG